MKILMTLLLSICLSANVVSADELRSTRGQGLIEKSHHVDVYIKDGVARLRVRRSFYNPGKLHEQAEMVLHLPRGAAATGLRIKAGNTWYKGELMEAAKAAALYEKLTGMGPHTPRDPALLSWSWVDELFLSMFPIAPKRTSFVEYTLTMPTEYFEGRYLISYPRAGKKKTKEQLAAGENELAIPTITVRGRSGVKIDGKKAGKKAILADTKRASILEKHDYPTKYRYAIIPLEIKESHFADKARLDVDIDHTWSGDVGLDLISPNGVVFNIDDGDWAGEDENEKSIEHILDGNTESKGTWNLIAWDTYPNIDSGQITKWSLSFGKKDKRETFEYSRPTAVPNSANLAIAQISIPARIAGKIDFRYAKVDLLKKKKFLSYELNLAKRISKLPNNLHLSLLLDASHSMRLQHVESARLLIREILALVPNAKVDLVLFDREPRLFGGKTWRAQDLFVELKKLTFVPHNGSNLDRAIEWSEKRVTRHRGTHEMIVLTDARFRPNWSTKTVAAGLKAKKKAPLHVIQFEYGADLFQRSDALSLFPIAKKRGGVAMRVGFLENYRRSKLKKDALYLLRPTQIENIEINKESFGTIKEGVGTKAYFFEEKAPKKISFYGELWSTPLTKTVSANRSNSKALGAFVFSLDRFDALSDEEQLKLAMWANVVSPVTSFLAVEPGVRPSTIGLNRSGTGSGGLGMSGMGRGGSGSAAPPVDLLSELQPALDKCASLRKGAQRILVDLTSREIVDVRPDSHSNKKATQCLTEAIWKIDLSENSNWPKKRTFEINVPGKIR